MPKYLIEGSCDGSLFGEAIEADNLEMATEAARLRLCEAWGENPDDIESLDDLGDAANVTEFSAEDYARDAARDMLAFVEQIERLQTTTEMEGSDDFGNDEAMNALIAKARDLAKRARGEVWAKAIAAAEPPFLCRGCGREEGVCSAAPCDDVITDREA